MYISPCLALSLSLIADSGGSIHVRAFWNGAVAAIAQKRRDQSGSNAGLLNFDMCAFSHVSQV